MGLGSALALEGLGLEVQGIPAPWITLLFSDLFQEIIVRNPKMVGSLGSR